MKAKLTDRLIQSLTLPEQVYEICDTELKGFRLIVRPTGTFTFILRYRNLAQKRQTRTLGRWGGEITTTVARSRAKLLLSQVNLGVDVQAAHQEEQARQRRQEETTLQAFVEDYWLPWGQTHLKSWQGSLDTLKRDFSHFWQKPITAISPLSLEKWQATALSQGIKPATINRRIAALKGVLSRAVVYGVIDSHPLAGFKKLPDDTDKRIRYLSPEEEITLRQGLIKRQEVQRQERLNYIAWCEARHLEAPPPLSAPFTDHLMPMTLLAMNTGMRRGELFQLEWGDINFHTGQITVRAINAKSRRTRYIPMNDEARRVLQTWQHQSRSDRLVFPSPVTNGALDNISHAWKGLMKQTGLKDFRFHDLRHHFASWLVMKGVSLYAVKELLGHASIETTQRYAHLAADHMAEAVNRLVPQPPAAASGGLQVITSTTGAA